MHVTHQSHKYEQDVVISSDGQFCLTGSWDGTLRLWDLNTGATTRRFVGHTKVGALCAVWARSLACVLCNVRVVLFDV